MKERIFVTSDIHGQYEAFDMLLQKISYNPEKDMMIVLGDMIDRGPDSASVVERVIQEKMIAIKGNHEQFLLDYIDDNLSSSTYFTPLFGGKPTLDSYKRRKDPEGDFERHIDFIDTLNSAVVVGLEYIMIHEAYPPMVDSLGRNIISGHVNTEIISMAMNNKLEGFIFYDEKTKNIFIDCTGKKTGAKIACLDIMNKQEHYVYHKTLEYITRRCPLDWI